MKKSCLLAAVVMLLLTIPLPVRADEESKYNFASAQGGKGIAVMPGSEGKGVIYFYNIDGNRITHITLEVSQVPEDWDVEIDPPMHDMQVEVSGRVVTVTENLYVEPSEALTEEPTEVPEGMVSITVPTRGYVLAKAVYIIVRVPEDEEIGTTGDIIVSAEAFWLGQTGAAAVKQARDFEFSVEVISGEEEFTETIIGEIEKPEPEKPRITQPAKTESGEGAKPEEALPSPPPPGESIPLTDSLMRWLPTVIAVLVVVLAAILIPIIIARRRG
jgi:hypothetical protein